MYDILLKILHTQEVRILFVIIIRIIFFNLILYKFMDKLLVVKKKNGKNTICFVINGILLLGLYVIKQPFWNGIYICICILVLPIFLCNLKVRKYFIYVISNIAIYSISFYIVYEIWYCTSLFEFISSPYLLYIYNILITIVLVAIHNIYFIVIDIFNISNKKHNKTNSIILGLMEILLLYGVFDYSLIEIKNKFNHSAGAYDDIKIMVLCLISITIIYIILWGFKKIEKAREYEKQLMLMELQEKLNLEKYVELSQKYEANRKVIHDLNKHLNVLEGLVYTEGDVVTYYNDIKKNVLQLSSIFYCDNKILNVIMNQKLIEAENKSIKVNIDIMDIDFGFIKDLDVSTLFTNLWDNAIEASTKNDANKRYINIKIGRVMDFIIIVFENSYNGFIRKEGKKILSTKGENRGLGLSIINDTIKKYDGQLIIDTKNEKFIIKTIIPIT